MFVASFNAFYDTAEAMNLKAGATKTLLGS